MNKVLDFNEANQTITVQAGIYGPALEEILNNAPSTLKAKRRYTCGHFPQSFMHSSVGGWVVLHVCRSKLHLLWKNRRLVLSQKYITPLRSSNPGVSTLRNRARLHSIMTVRRPFGVLAEGTLKLYRYQPEAIQRYSTYFKSWEEAQFGRPEINAGLRPVSIGVRLSDPEKRIGACACINPCISADTVLKDSGYRPCSVAFFGFLRGDKAYARLRQKDNCQNSPKIQGFPMTTFGVTPALGESPFNDPYLGKFEWTSGFYRHARMCCYLDKSISHVPSFCQKSPRPVCMTHPISTSLMHKLYFILSNTCTHRIIISLNYNTASYRPYRNLELP